MRAWKFFGLSVLLLAGSTGCSSSDAGPPAAAANAPAPPPAATTQTVPSPTLRFLDAAGKDVESIFVSDAFKLRVEGLTPGKPVEITATMKPWSSRATFVADETGSVDTSRDAPTTGSYSDVDPDGFFWSMDTEAFAYAASADVVFTVKAEGAPELVTRVLAREWTLPGVRTVTPDDKTIVGTLYVPPGSGKRPAMLAFGGSEGGTFGAEAYAGDLVHDGYVVLGIAYFADSGLPAELRDIPLEYFANALAWLAKQPDVDPARMGVIGGSRGGELALLLASRHPELKVAIADSPSGYRWGAVDGVGAAWTVGGQPLGYVTNMSGNPRRVTTAKGESALAYTPMFEASLAASTAAELTAARTEVEKSGAAIAMFAGADDQLWPGCKLAQVAMDKLIASGHQQAHGDELTCFEGAGHLVDSVGLPTTRSAFSPDPVGGSEMLALGGTPGGAARAGRARLAKVRDFMSRAFAK